jgi:pheromone shutdown-related protein TraB
MSDAGEPVPTAPAANGNVTRVDRGDKEIHLLGTAHVSKKSVDEVRRIIAELRPDSVAVELDRARYETLADETRFGRVDVRDVLAKGRAGLYLSSLLFAGFQKRLGDRLGVKPGAEMLAGVEAAERLGANVVFADREVQVTLMRCYRSLGFLERLQVLAVLVMLPFASSDIDEAEVERLKERETIGDVMQTFAEQLPTLKTPLIDERDQYLAASIAKAPGRRIVAVVGAAHVPGVERRLERDVDTSSLDVIPPAPARAHVLPLVFPLCGLAVAAAALLGRIDPTTSMVSVERWSIATALGALLFAVVAGAAPASALACALLAPVTLLLPFIPFGRAVGMLEARTRPPSPEHAMRARNDILAPAAARKSRFLRPLLLAVFASFGRTLGAVIGVVWAVVHALR